MAHYAASGQLGLISLSLLKNEVKIADELPTRSIVEIASEAVQYILHNEDGPYSIYGHCVGSYLYGHCVGSYLALEIANQLEQNKIKVNSLFVSATYPVSNWLTPLPFHDPWCFHSDQKLLKNLEHWKTEKFDADKITLSHILKSFRTDAKVAYHYQRTVSLRRLSCPLFCIYAEDDPLTRGGHTRFARWKEFTNDAKLLVLNSGGHYFVESVPADTAKLIAYYRP